MTAGERQSGPRDDGDAPEITSVQDLIAHAVALEAEAEERYRDLADQMEAHNNTEVAALFRTLADYEGQHARRLGTQAKEMGAGEQPPWRHAWPDPESPESVAVLDVHYMMTAAHALRLALEAERRAHAFYRRIADGASDEGLRTAAQDMVAEEAQHIRLVEDMLAKYPEPESDWDYDPDPPIESE
jgi:rubrerythrin